MKIPHPDFFLRAYLVCPHCGHAITASHSRSHNGNKYAYYHCSYDQKHLRVRAEQANKEFARYVGALKPNKTVLAYYEKVLEDIRSDGQKDARKVIQKYEDEISTLQARIDKAVVALIDGKITPEDKERLESRCKREIASKRERIEVLKTSNSTNLEPKLGYAMALINNLEGLMTDAPTETKMRVLSSMFPQKIEFDGENYRTTTYNKVLDLIYQQTNELRGSKKSKEGEVF